MKSARLLRTLMAATVLLVAGPGTPAEAADTISRPVLRDEFDGAVGTGPNSGRWAVAGDPRAAQLTGEGQLWLAAVLRAQEPLTQKNGRAEARIRVDREGGAWQALGVLTPAGGLPAGRAEVLGDGQVRDFDFHTYAIDWTPTSLVWSVDGHQILRFTPDVAGQPLVLAVNTAAGGRRPDTMLIDWVRVTAEVTVNATGWKAYTTYERGKYVRHQGTIYRVRELHTSLPGWQPPLVPALFQKF